MVRLSAPCQMAVVPPVWFRRTCRIYTPALILWGSAGVGRERSVNEPPASSTMRSAISRAETHKYAYED